MFDVHPIEALKNHLERWKAIRTSCDPVDHGIAESGIIQAYEAAGLKRPERIIWCGGPVEIAKALTAVAASDRIGRNVKDEIFNAPRDRAKTIAEIFWKEILVAATEVQYSTALKQARVSLEQSKALGRAADRAVSYAAIDILSRISVRARHQCKQWGGLPRVLPRSKFSDIAIDPEDLGSLDVYEYLRDVAAWSEQTNSIAGLLTLAACGCWLAPYEHVCWIAERPVRRLADATGRLHCGNGPALQFCDGWSAYAWKGVLVPSWMIEHPDQITADKIGSQFGPTLRNTMIDIMTPERFINEGRLRRVSVDETGVLWQKSWAVHNFNIGSWSAVEVVNGTPERDGAKRKYILRVPSECRSAREAVAWTYGLTADQYANLGQRT
jgi:hypothetical protein